jgi:hypothetical protein
MDVVLNFKEGDEVVVKPECYHELYDLSWRWSETIQPDDWAICRKINEDAQTCTLEWTRHTENGTVTVIHIMPLHQIVHFCKKT